MGIELMKDVGVPVLVGAADIGLSYWDEQRLATTPTAMKFEPLLGVVGAVAGYGLMMGNMWLKVAEPLAHAAAPLAVRSIYTWVREWMTPVAASRVSRVTRFAIPASQASPVGAVGRYPAPATKPEFNLTPAY